MDEGGIVRGGFSLFVCTFRYKQHHAFGMIENMKILIVSDSHGRDTYLEQVIEREKPIDMLLHMGDLEGSEDYISAIAPCPVEMVSGNNDYFTQIDREKIIKIGTYKVFMTHGHRFGVNFGMEEITEEGRTRNVDIVMFGHTHKPYLNVLPDITVLNPGSISQPRQEGRNPSYMIMEIAENGGVRYDIRYFYK